MCYTKTMYVGVDIGGTKTYVAALDEHGVITEKHKFATPPSYTQFVVMLGEAAQALRVHDFRAGCVAVPGRVDRKHGIGEYFGNLPWKHVPIQADAERIFACPMLVEHDTNLGGLSESMLLPSDRRVLYVTISTGIGTGLIDRRHIVRDLADAEGGQMLLDFHGKRLPWEDFASGHALVERFGKKAAEITDAATWRRIAYDLAQGFTELIAIMQPDIIVIGGSVGQYFDHFGPFLIEELKSYHNPLVPVPTIQAAARPDEAVLFGCYDLAHTHYGQHA